MSKNSLFAMFGTSTQDEVNGVWVNYGTTRVLVAHAGGANTDYQRLLVKLGKPYLKLIKSGNLPEEVTQEIEETLYSKTIIKGMEVKLSDDWQAGVPDAEGNILPYTPENVIELLRTLPHLFTDIKTFASDISNFKPDLEEAKGN